MKKTPFILYAILLLIGVLTSCDNGETYAEQKEKELKAITSFLSRDITIRDANGEIFCPIGTINPISEEQFLAQDSMTDVSKNEYVLFSNSGV